MGEAFMKHKFISLLVTCILSGVISAVQVTFQVDMQNEDTSNGVYMVGYWDWTFYQMSQIGNSTTYSFTHDFSDPGSEYDYWFAAGSGWGDIEIITRSITVPSENTVLEAVCYNAFEACPDDVVYEVTLSFIDENQSWDNIWFKTSVDDFTVPYQGNNNGSGNWTFTADYSPGTYSWGAYQSSDNEGTQDVWLTPNNPNLAFTLANDGTLSGEYSYELETFPVTFTINDGTETFTDIYLRLGSSDFAYPNWGVEIICLDDDGDHSWTCSIALEPSDLIFWKAFESGGTDLNGLIGEGNFTFSLSNDGSYNSAETTLDIPDLGEWVTNAVIFSVDMTEWLDEPGATGMPVFSVARNDEVQVRGDWNGWSDGTPENSVLIRQPGTNIFSLPVELSGFSEAQYSYKFYIKHSQESLTALEEQYGEMAELDWGWEDSPRYGGGNRLFTLSTNTGTTYLEEGYYDLPSGGAIPEGQTLMLTYAVNMNGEEGYSAGDNVNIVLRDKWNNFLQGYTIVEILDNNPVAKFPASCNGGICTVGITQTGPFPWHTLYTWEYQNSDGDWIEEGGQYGDFGKYRARYISPNNDGSWTDHTFPTDQFQLLPPYTPEDPPATCVEIGDLNGDGGWNVLDIVTLANCILANNCADLEFGCAGDLNGDGFYNVLDIVTLANCILAQNCGGRVDDAASAELMKKDNTLSIEADGFIGGVQMTLSHSESFKIELTDRALYANSITEGTETRLIIVTPETDHLFSYSGDFDIEAVIVANSQDEVAVSLPVAMEYSLSQAYPNPFNPITSMSLTMPVSGEISVQVYNLMGQSIATLATGYHDAGTYNLTWDATDVSSGMYFVKAQAEGFTHTQKLMLVK
jgi:hypothetical protein